MTTTAGNVTLFEERQQPTGYGFIEIDPVSVDIIIRSGHSIAIDANEIYWADTVELPDLGYLGSDLYIWMPCYPRPLQGPTKHYRKVTIGIQGRTALAAYGRGCLQQHPGNDSLVMHTLASKLSVPTDQSLRARFARLALISTECPAPAASGHRVVPGSSNGNTSSAHQGVSGLFAAAERVRLAKTVWAQQWVQEHPQEDPRPPQNFLFTRSGIHFVEQFHDQLIAIWAILCYDERDRSFVRLLRPLYGPGSQHPRSRMFQNRDGRRLQLDVAPPPRPGQQISAWWRDIGLQDAVYEVLHARLCRLEATSLRPLCFWLPPTAIRRSNLSDGTHSYQISEIY